MHILADFITKLPLAQGYDSILVVVDWLTKMVHFIPTTEKMSTEGLAKLFRDNIERMQKGITHWDKQNNDVPAPNCMLKV